MRELLYIQLHMILCIIKLERLEYSFRNFETFHQSSGKEEHVIGLYQTSCAVNRSSSSKWFLLKNFMDIDGTTLKSFFWFLRLFAGPQKLEHKVDPNYFTVQVLKKVRDIFLIRVSVLCHFSTKKLIDKKRVQFIIKMLNKKFIR